MNHAATSREALLQASLSFAAQEGLRSLNIRSIAGACGVSVGCVYRYFPSKAALISATVGKIWEHIFHMTASGCAQDDFRSCVSWVFACIRNGCQEYPSFFRQHADAFSAGERQDGRRVMDQYLGHIRGMLLRALELDPAIRPDAFTALTREELAAFVLDNLLFLGMRRAESCGTLLAVIETLLY